DFKNSKEAETAARRAADPIMERVNEHNRGTGPSKPQTEPSEPEITFKEFVEGPWKTYRASAKHELSTLDAHNSLTENHLMPFFGEKKMAEITPTDISNFFDKAQARSGKELSKNTKKALYRLTRLMFNVAVELELIDRNPIKIKLH